MDIGSIGSARDGLASTASAISQAQQRFDAAAEQTVNDAQALSSPEPQASSGQLPSDLANLQQERLVNSILYAVFQRQQQNGKDLTGLITPH